MKPFLDFVLDIEQEVAILWNILWYQRANDVSEDPGGIGVVVFLMRSTRTCSLFLVS
jgi:hypothetical protein